MRGGRVAHACAVTEVGGSHVLVISGGQNGGEFLSSVQALPLHNDDNDEQQWFALPDLLKPRRNHIMTVLAGSLLVIGGDTAIYEPIVGFLYQLVPEIETLKIHTDNEGNVPEIKDSWVLTNKSLLSPRTVMSYSRIKRRFCRIK